MSRSCSATSSAVKPFPSNAAALAPAINNVDTISAWPIEMAISPKRNRVIIQQNMWTATGKLRARVRGKCNRRMDTKSATMYADNWVVIISHLPLEHLVVSGNHTLAGSLVQR